MSDIRFVSHRAIIEAWPSLADFAADVGVAYGAAKAMRRRDRIGIEYVSAAVAGAAKRGIGGITSNLIVELAARRPAAGGEGDTQHAPT
jgi:hypothetical protein